MNKGNTMREPIVILLKNKLEDDQSIIAILNTGGVTITLGQFKPYYMEGNPYYTEIKDLLRPHLSDEAIACYNYSVIAYDLSSGTSEKHNSLWAF